MVSAAAICLTPASWVTRWNIWDREQVRFFASEITSLNTTLGRDMSGSKVDQILAKKRYQPTRVGVAHPNRRCPALRSNTTSGSCKQTRHHR